MSLTGDVGEVAAVPVAAGWCSAGEVGAGAEASSLAGKYGDPQAGIVREIGPDTTELLVHLGVHGVELIGPVEGDMRDGTALLVQHRRQFHRLPPKFVTLFQTEVTANRRPG